MRAPPTTNQFSVTLGSDVNGTGYNFVDYLQPVIPG